MFFQKLVDILTRISFQMVTKFIDTSNFAFFDFKYHLCEGDLHNFDFFFEHIDAHWLGEVFFENVGVWKVRVFTHCYVHLSFTEVFRGS